MTTLTQYTLDEMIAEFKATNDGDTYGNCMSWWFAVANELAIRGDDIPSTWQFSAGACGPQREDSFEAQVCELTDSSTLELFGDKMERLYNICKARKWDY